jgi:hypothetical protein
MKNTDFGCLRTGSCGGYLDPEERKQEDTEEYCIIRNFRICTFNHCYGIKIKEDKTDGTVTTNGRKNVILCRSGLWFRVVYYRPTRLHRIITQMIIIWIFTAIRTSTITYKILVDHATTQALGRRFLFAVGRLRSQVRSCGGQRALRQVFRLPWKFSPHQLLHMH